MQLRGGRQALGCPELPPSGSEGLENRHRRAIEPHRHVAVGDATEVPIRDSTITGTQNVVISAFRTRSDNQAATCAAGLPSDDYAVRLSAACADATARSYVSLGG
jgi:hypothetical protein